MEVNALETSRAIIIRLICLGMRLDMDKVSPSISFHHLLNNSSNIGQGL